MRDYRDVIRTATQATDGDEAEFARVAARARLQAAGGRRNRAASIAAVTAGLLLAAGLLWGVIPPPRVDRAFDAPSVAALGDFVRVEAAGTGDVTGVAKAMEVRWTDGRLGVEVEPDRGVVFVVRTDEATVRVVGTGFDVVRDVLGTTVAVRHGRVAVECARGGSSALGAGERAVCPPTQAAGALGRVLALRASVSPEALISEVDTALSLPDADGPVAAELHVLRVSGLLAAGRESAAAAEAELALALPEVTRAEELHRVAARVYVGRSDCRAALPHLLALEAAGALGDDAPALAACRAH